MERMEQYFLANDIKEEKKNRAILLSVCGSKTYTLEGGVQIRCETSALRKQPSG